MIPITLDVKFPGKEYQFWGFYRYRSTAVERGEQLRKKHPGTFYIARQLGKVLAQK